MNSFYRVALCLTVAGTLAACSGGAEQRRQAKQDFKYMDTPNLKPLVVPQDEPVYFSTHYMIPSGEKSGFVGKQVDIRPPLQILELIPGARSEEQDGVVTIWTIREQETNDIWNSIIKAIANKKIKIRSQSIDKIETDWVRWNIEDEDLEYGVRYLIERINKDDQLGLRFSTLEWQRNGQETSADTLSRDRYSIQMANMVTSYYDTQQRIIAQKKADELIKRIPISLGHDRSGLPVIIARAPYNIFWARLPKLLDNFGFEITSRNSSQGMIDVKYKSPDDEFWQELGTSPLQLDNNEYKIQLGDLGNRTSLNVTDKDGKPVNEEILKSLAPILSAVVERENSKDKSK
ncbi:outer membrane protein assembly factor BamC [Vibrio sp. SS-MA-C1-2]|uniref:outer membrane protein assembly factor BamC n=1 Tax=Vibrio sp. SS-MA-C1-2 TaxID=2908646 RepID=UPI001F20B534|nr:outer membrane protein assembly factor BamC [Vibrio sp. SS-MA-C1-2]UJF19788.1 outer membrane protein assembly factor BamC [Vibrio sp. SS-MA-C1-2]